MSIHRSFCVQSVLIGSSDLIVSRSDVWVTLSVRHMLHTRVKERRGVNTPSNDSREGPTYERTISTRSTVAWKNGHL